MRSIELTLDEATDAAFRADWDALLLAGLPSQARHTGASNRPHVTIGAGDRFPFADEPSRPEGTDAAAAAPDDTDATRAGAFRRSRLLLIAQRLHALPLDLGFSGLVVFGAPPRGLVLARLVAPAAALIGLHSAVHAVAPGTGALTAPGRWTPHVTLAHRLSPDQLAQAIALVAPLPDGSATGARLWDSSTREITALA